MYLLLFLLFVSTSILLFNSMQDFEIHGRAMQLGWGQENSEDRMSNAKHFRTSVSKGNVVSDTFYPGAVDLLSK